MARKMRTRRKNFLAIRDNTSISDNRLQAGLAVPGFDLSLAVAAAWM